MYRSTFSALVFAAFSLFLFYGCTSTITKDIDPNTNSIVIGKFTGHIIAEKGHQYYYNRESPEWKFDNFELENVNTEKVWRLFLNKKGFYSIALPPGEYWLQQNVKGKGSSSKTRKKEYLVMKRISVPVGSLVNAGTILIEYEPPSSDVIYRSVQYRLVKIETDDGYLEPLYWFRSKYSEVFSKYEHNIESPALEKLPDFSPTTQGK